MNPGDYAVESWRDADRDPNRRWAPPIPVWEIVAWGPAVIVRLVGSNQTATVLSGDLRPATDEEVIRARVLA